MAGGVEVTRTMKWTLVLDEAANDAVRRALHLALTAETEIGEEPLTKEQVVTLREILNGTDPQDF